MATKKKPLIKVILIGDSGYSPFLLTSEWERRP